MKPIVWLIAATSLLLTTSAALACSIGPPEGIKWPYTEGVLLPSNGDFVFESEEPIVAILINGEPADLAMDPAPNYFYRSTIIRSAGNVTEGDVIEIVPGQEWAAEEMRTLIEVGPAKELPHVEPEPTARYFFRHTDVDMVGDGASCGPSGNWNTEVALELKFPEDASARVVSIQIGDGNLRGGIVSGEVLWTEILTQQDKTVPCVTIHADDLFGTRWTRELCEPDLCAVSPENPLPASATSYNDGASHHPAGRNEWAGVPEDSCGVDVTDPQPREEDESDDSVFDDLDSGESSGSRRSDNCTVSSSAPTSLWRLLTRR